MKNNRNFIGAGLLAALTASLCCITPVLAFVAGAGGFASLFSWLEPFRPFFIFFTIAVLGFAWYQKLKPRVSPEINCDCETENKSPFAQSKMFLSTVTVFAVVTLLFPFYAHVFYPKVEQKTITATSSNIQTIEFKISGMTCNGCAEHVNHEVNQLEGVIQSNASYEQKNAIITFDKTQTSLAEVEKTINATGYSVIGKEDK